MADARHCDKIAQKVMATEDWKKIHRPHFSWYESEGFRREPFPHPSGEWAYIVCPCGAKHLCSKEEEV